MQIIAGLVIKKSVCIHSRESPSFPFLLPLPDGIGSYILSCRPEGTSCPSAVVFAGCSSAAFWLRRRRVRQQSPLILWCWCGSCGPLHSLWADQLISAHLATWWGWFQFLSFFNNSIRIRKQFIFPRMKSKPRRPAKGNTIYRKGVLSASWPCQAATCQSSSVVCVLIRYFLASSYY